MSQRPWKIYNKVLTLIKYQLLGQPKLISLKRILFHGKIKFFNSFFSISLNLIIQIFQNFKFSNSQIF